MERYEDYEKLVKEQEKRNKKFLKEFKNWLDNKGLGEKTKRKHLDNMEFYLNDYLNYYEATKMEDGINMAYSFLNDWFIRKCLYASKTSIMENAASIKKFYKCMSELGYVKETDYEELAKEINDNVDEFYASLIEINDYEGEEWEAFF